MPNDPPIPGTTPVGRRDDALWEELFNSIPKETTDGRWIAPSRRMVMADAAWLIAEASPQDPKDVAVFEMMGQGPVV